MIEKIIYLVIKVELQVPDNWIGAEDEIVDHFSGFCDYHVSRGDSDFKVKNTDMIACETECPV